MENLCDLSVISSELLVNGMMKSAVYFHKIDEPNGFLSNWYPSNFEIDGMKFCNVEQYIMYRKCTVFGDFKAAEAVMATSDPETQKAIAGKAQGYNETIWNGLRQVVLTRALIAKFEQNLSLREALLKTENDYLVECARSDKIWACGLSLYDDARKDIANWRGTNILGFALMEVREILKNVNFQNTFL